MSNLISVFTLLLGISLFSVVQGQEGIWFITEPNGNADDDGCRVDSSTPKATSIARAARKACVNGLWALYTEPNYGQAEIKNVTVYPAMGGSKAACTGASAASIFKRIRSIRQLATAALPFTFFTNPYFLSSSSVTSSATLVPATAMTAKSFAIHKDALPANQIFKLCPADTADMKCLCIDLKVTKSLLVPDIKTFPTAANGFETIGLAMANSDASKTTCLLAFPNVPELPAPTLRADNEVILVGGSDLSF